MAPFKKIRKVIFWTKFQDQYPARSLGSYSKLQLQAISCSRSPQGCNQSISCPIEAKQCNDLVLNIGRINLLFFFLAITFPVLNAFIMLGTLVQPSMDATSWTKCAKMGDFVPFDNNKIRLLYRHSQNYWLLEILLTWFVKD